VKYAWLDAERKRYPLPMLCETLEVSLFGAMEPPMFGVMAPL
jgi:hypothetical protein